MCVCVWAHLGGTAISNFLFLHIMIFVLALSICTLLIFLLSPTPPSQPLPFPLSIIHYPCMPCVSMRRCAWLCFTRLITGCDYLATLAAMDPAPSARELLCVGEIARFFGGEHSGNNSERLLCTLCWVRRGADGSGLMGSRFLSEVVVFLCLLCSPVFLFWGSDQMQK